MEDVAGTILVRVVSALRWHCLMLMLNMPDWDT